MNTNNYPDFSSAVEKYFQRYLATERGASSHTIKSYANAFSQLLDYFKEKHKIDANDIGFELIDRDSILDYLNWIEIDHHDSISTRNNRLFVMRSFFNYMTYLDPTHINQWKSICAIKKKKCDSLPPNYLTIDGIKALLSEIDISNIRGRRNLTMLSLLYNTGARVQELADLVIGSLRLTKPYCITLHGKGDKERQVPLEDSIVTLLLRYIKENNLDGMYMGKHPLFFNSRHEKLTTMGITYILKRYADKARIKHPDLIPEIVSPHSLRHSKAMHLLMAGCPLLYIRDILGHVSITTTEIYARTDSEHKRKALENAYEKIGITPPGLTTWEQSPKLREYLKSLGKRDK
jgi:site-specific recombinase XerD